MPRGFSVALKAHLALESTTVAVCWKVTRTDGQVFGFTTHTSDLVISAVTYKALGGSIPTSVRNSAGVGVDNMTVMAALSGSQITEADLLSGKYDDAAVEVFIVNYLDLSMGVGKIISGNVGEIVTMNGRFEAEFRSLIQRAAQKMGSVCSPLCRVAQLGDAVCRPGDPSWIAGFQNAGTVSSVIDSRQFNTSVSLADGYFAYGTVKFTSGAANGLTFEVKRSFNASGKIEVQTPIPVTIAPGDSILLTAGCDRLHTTCLGKFSNLDNFQGEPFVPGQDFVLKVR